MLFDTTFSPILPTPVLSKESVLLATDSDVSMEDVVECTEDARPLELRVRVEGLSQKPCLLEVDMTTDNGEVGAVIDC